jgi:hypothetical protein
MMLDYHVEQALNIDIREDKLPVWARDKMTAMRRATNESRTMLLEFMVGSEPGPFWFAPWSGDDTKRFYLPQHSGRLMYGDPASANEDFTISNGGNHRGKDDLLTIVAREGLAVLPNCSNVIQLKRVEL